MKKCNWKILNSAFWIEVVLSYLLPFRVRNDFQYQVGVPMSFISVYDTDIGINPLMSMHLNPLALLFDVFVIYLIILVCVRSYKKFKNGSA